MFVNDSQSYFSAKPPRSYYLNEDQDEIGQGGAVGFFGDDVIPAVDVRQQFGWYPFAHTDLEEILPLPVTPQHQCAGNVVDDSSTGTVAWSNPANAIGRPDGISATASLSLASPTSHYLKTSNHAFNIPPAAVIVGFVITIRVAGQVSAITDNQIRLVKGGVIGSTNRSNGTVWPNTLTDESYGGATDLWGTTWLPSDVNSTGFGAAIAAVNTLSGTRIASVDAICIDVYFVPVIDDEFGFVDVQRSVWQQPVPWSPFAYSEQEEQISRTPHIDDEQVLPAFSQVFTWTPVETRELESEGKLLPNPFLEEDPVYPIFQLVTWNPFAYSDQEDQVSHPPSIEEDVQSLLAPIAWTVIEWALVINQDGDALLQLALEDEWWIVTQIQSSIYVWTAYIPIVHEELTPIIHIELDDFVAFYTQSFVWVTPLAYWEIEEGGGLKNFFLEDEWGVSSTQLFQWVTYPTYWLEDDAGSLKNFFLEEDWGASVTQLFQWIATPTYWFEDDAPGLKIFFLEDEWWVRVEHQIQLSSYVWLSYVPPYETDVGNAGLKNFFLEDEWGSSSTQSYPYAVIYAPPFEFDVGNAGLANFFLEDEWGGSSVQAIIWNSATPNVDPIDLAIAFIVDEDNGNMPGFTLVSWNPFALMVEEFQQQIFSIEDLYVPVAQTYTISWSSIPMPVDDENFVAFHVEDELGQSAIQTILWYPYLSPLFEMDEANVAVVHVEDELLLPPLTSVLSWYSVVPVVDELRTSIIAGEDEWSQSSQQVIAWVPVIPITHEEIGVGFRLEDDQQPFTFSGFLFSGSLQYFSSFQYFSTFQQVIQWQSSTTITDEIWLSGATPVTTPAVLFQLIAYNPGLEQCTAFNPGMQQAASGA